MSTATGSLMVTVSPLVLAGTDAQIIPLVNARIMRRLMPDATQGDYDNGHLALVTQPHALAPVVTDLLLN